MCTLIFTTSVTLCASEGGENSSTGEQLQAEESSGDAAGDSDTAEPSSEVNEDGQKNGTAEEKAEAAEEVEDAAPMSTTTTTLEDEDEAAVDIPAPESLTAIGALSYRIPIKVPRGRNGIDPNIGFIYKNYLKNSWLGVGWDLDMGSIRQSAKKGVVYHDPAAADEEGELNKACFVFVKDGTKKELTSRKYEDNWGDNCYGAVIEEAYSRFYFDSNANAWIRTTKDGTKYYYGQTAGTRQVSGNDTFSWYLDKIEDTNGNAITITYTQDQGQIYPSEITYPGGGAEKKIKFILEDRNDVTTSWLTHGEIKTAKRLNSVETYTGAELIRTYRLTYSQGTSSVQSRIATITENGYDGEEDIPLPPYTLACQEGGSGLWSLLAQPTGLPYTGFNAPELTSPFYSIEINGDGKADLFINGHYYLSNGDGSFDYGGMMSISYTVMGDFNGDGITDLCTYVYTNPLGEPYPALFHQLVVKLGNGNGSFGDPIITDLDLTDPQLEGTFFVSDANGDGYQDIIVIKEPPDDTEYQIVYSEGGGYFDNSSFGEGTLAWSTNFQHERRFADVNGDGLADAIQYEYDTGGWPLYTITSRVTVCLGKGDGDFTTGIVTDFGTTWLRKFDIIEANGDAMADITANTGNYRSNGDGTFQTSSYGQGLGVLNYRYVFADFSGDGVTDKVSYYFNDYGFYTEGGFQVYFAGGNGRPDLLTGIDDPYGAAAAIEYTVSTEYQNTALSFPLYVVSSLEIDPGVGVSSTTTYEYEGGVYNPDDRAFWGFATVTKTNPNDTVEVTTNHQDRFRRGKAYQVTVTEPGELTPFSVTSNTWETVPSDPSSYGDWAFVKLTQTRTDLYDDQQVYTQENYTYDDDNGNLENVVSSGTGGSSIETVKTYINKQAAYGGWLWRTETEKLKNNLGILVRDTRYTYDDAGNMLTLTRILSGNSGPAVTMTYDSWGNMLTEQDARGNRTVMEYDAPTHSYLTKIAYPQTNGVNHIVEYTDYDDRFGRVKEKKDQNGNYTTYDYDCFGRRAHICYPDGGETLKTYTDDVVPRIALTQVKESASPLSYINKYEYFDGLSRPVQTVTFGENATPIATKWTYDDMGRTSRIDGPFFAVGNAYPQTPPASYHYQDISYDYRNRPADSVEPDGTYGPVTKVRFDYSGFSTTITDADNSMKTETRDYLGRIVEVEEHIGTGQITTYSYNAAGDLRTIVDATRITATTYTYDLLGRKIEMDDPDLGAWTFGYDANDNLTQQTDSENQTIIMTYDELNRITTKSYSTGDPTVTYSYDNATNGKPHLSLVSKGTTSTNYTVYDAMGRPTTINRIIDGAGPYTTGYQYDLSGKTAAITYPDATTVTYTYHAGSGLIDSVVQGVTSYASFVNYTPEGKIGLVDYGNNTTTTYTYDAESTRLTDIVTHDSQNTSLQQRTYTYTRAGDIWSIIDGVRSITYSYGYDALHRLVSESNNGGYPAVSFTYNAIGNITSKTVGANTLTYTYANNDHKHAVSSIALNGNPQAFTYDGNGNMLTGPDFTDLGSVAQRTAINYNADNMPTSITHSTGGTVTFTYDGEGKRAKKVGGGTTLYIGDHYEIIDGTATKYIFAGNLRVTKISTEGTFYFHKDHLGSSTVMTDCNGISWEERTEYMPFGSMRIHEGIDLTAYKFTDQELDAETGLYNYGARLYDPLIGRFICADIIIPDLYNPQSLNRYSYCLNNPLIYVDPNGQFSFSIGQYSVAVSLGHLGYSALCAIEAVGAFAAATTVPIGFASVAGPPGAIVGTVTVTPGLLALSYFKASEFQENFHMGVHVEAHDREKDKTDDEESEEQDDNTGNNSESGDTEGSGDGDSESSSYADGEGSTGSTTGESSSSGNNSSGQNSSGSESSDSSPGGNADASGDDK